MWQNIYKEYNLEDKPRKLSEEEIEKIISSVPLPNIKDKDEINTFKRNIFIWLNKNLREIELCPSAIPELIRTIKEKFFQSLIIPGSPIGIYAANAIGSTLTQTTLNTFHRAGDKKTVFTIINLLEEMIYARKKRKETKFSLYFKEPISYEDAFIEGKKIIEANMSEFISSYEIDTLEKLGKRWWHDLYKIPSSYKERKILRLYINMEKLYEHRITLQHIVNKLKFNQNISLKDVINSPLDEGIIEIYPNSENLSNQLHTHGITEIEYFSVEEMFYVLLLSNIFKELLIKGVKGANRFQVIKYDLINVLSYNNKEDSWIINFNKLETYRRRINVKFIERFISLLGLKIRERKEEELNISWILELPKDIYYLTRDDFVYKEGEEYYSISSDNKKELVLDVKNLKTFKPREYIERKIYFAKERFRKLIENNNNKTNEEKRIMRYEREEILKASEFVYLEIKSNSEKIESKELTFLDFILNEKFDPYSSYPHNMHTINNLIGIEATRNFILTSLKEILIDQGQYIHPIHIAVLAEFICSLGEPYGANYTGISRQGTKHLTLSTTERAKDVFSESALTGQKEEINNVSAAIMVGVRMSLGNGLFHLVQEIEENNEKKYLVDDEIIRYHLQKNIIAEEREELKSKPESLDEALNMLKNINTREVRKTSEELISYVNTMKTIPLTPTKEEKEEKITLIEDEIRTEGIDNSEVDIKWKTLIPDIPMNLMEQINEILGRKDKKLKVEKRNLTPVKAEIITEF